METFLSERGKVSKDWYDLFNRYSYLCEDNPFHHLYNRSGYVDIGSSVNSLCNDLIVKKINDIWICNYDSLNYKNSETCTIRLRKAIAKFMTEFFETSDPVSPYNLICLNGTTACIDYLSYCLADPGEVFLAPTPTYVRTHMNCMLRSNVDIFPVHVIAENETALNAKLTIEKIIDAYKIALKTDHVVRGILLINPNNPLGDIYSPKLLMEIMSFCKEKSLHLIVDEGFGLSVFSKDKAFHSILKFRQILDPDRTHVVYGLSKDFGIAGLRIGVLHTKCEQLLEIFTKLSHFQTIPYPVLDIASQLLEDLQWCRKYIFAYNMRLSSKYKKCVDFLKSMGLTVKNCQSGFLLWVDLRHLCGYTFIGERALFDLLFFHYRLYIGHGAQSFCNQPGWFQIAFSRDDYQLQEGFERLRTALKYWRPYRPLCKKKPPKSTSKDDSD